MTKIMTERKMRDPIELGRIIESNLGASSTIDLAEIVCKDMPLERVDDAVNRLCKKCENAGKPELKDLVWEMVDQIQPEVRASRLTLMLPKI